MIIPEDKYIEEKQPWIPMLRRMFELDYNMDYAKVESILNDFKWFNFQIMSADSMAEWIKTHTTLKEIEYKKFLLSEESINPMTWEII